VNIKSLLVRLIKTSVALVFFLVAIIEIVHINLLFYNGNLLAGGDNSSYLQLCRNTTNSYSWEESLPFGGRSYDVANLFGVSAFSKLACFLSQGNAERLLIFTLYFLKYLGFFLLSRKIFNKLSFFALLPALLLYIFNPFETLNPFPYLYLLYNAYIPLSLYLFIHLLDRQKLDFLTLAMVAVVSVIFSSINSNPALSITIFIPHIIYLIFKFRSLSRIRIINLLLYFTVLVLTNIWWIVAQILYFSSSAVSVFSGNWWDYTNQGSLLQNLRFIGQWGWYKGSYLYPYYPFNPYYDSPVVVIANYLVVALTLGYGIRLAIKKDIKVLFVLSFVIVSLILIGGSRPPFGFLYGYLYTHIPFFKVFREPFTKFGELYVLSFSLLFYRLLVGIKDWSKPYFLPNIFICFLFLVIIFGKPAIFGEHVWNKWNGSMRTFRVGIPQYWNDFYKYQRSNLSNERILTVPKIYYGGAWNWPKGFSSADDIAIYFVDNGNTILGRPINTGSISGKIVDSIYTDKNVTSDYFLSLGIKYLLRENDYDWRFSGELTLSPNELDGWINKLNAKKVAEFGKFTPDYLKTIPNEDPDPKIRDVLYKELLDRPALELYEISDKINTSRIFVESDSKVKISYSKINPTKYIVTVKDASSDYNLFFNETYDKNWEARIVGGNKIPNEQHTVENGYANLWKINTQDASGLSSYSVIIEYTPQKLIDFLVIGCLVTFFISLFYLIVRLVLRLHKR